MENEETNNNTENSTKTVVGRPFPKGVSGNPGGRPKGTMKDYLSRKFQALSDDEKEQFLKTHKVTGKDQIEFGEGKAKQDIAVEGEIDMMIKIDE